MRFLVISNDNKIIAMFEYIEDAEDFIDYQATIGKSFKLAIQNVLDLEKEEHNN